MRKFLGWAAVLLVLALFLAALLMPGLSGSQKASNDRAAYASLKTLLPAQEHFRLQDCDRNMKLDYWRKDIAGLYAFIPEDGKPKVQIGLIELMMACADDRPVVNIEKYGPRRPKAGYWYRALRFNGEKEPDPDRFAACTYPDTFNSGRLMFIISDKKIVYKKLILAPPVTPPEVYPDDPEKDGWERME